MHNPQLFCYGYHETTTKKPPSSWVGTFWVTGYKLHVTQTVLRTVWVTKKAILGSLGYIIFKKGLFCNPNCPPPKIKINLQQSEMAPKNFPKLIKITSKIGNKPNYLQNLKFVFC